MVYLDYAATCPILPEVWMAMSEAEKRFFANASALHTPGHRAMQEVEKCRELLAEMVGCDPAEIIFTAGATEANNTVVRTFMGCQIETSPLEHHSILETAEICRGERLPKLYSYMLANNETGEILSLPWAGIGAGRLSAMGARSKISAHDVFATDVVDEISTYDASATGMVDEVSACHSSVNPELFDVKNEWGKDLVTDRRSAYFHSDLTQVLGKMPINVKKLGLDYATFSAHKIGGPVGVGALYVRRGVPYKPLLIGGKQEGGRRGGTYNVLGIIGFRAALEKVQREEAARQYDTRVRNLRDTLARLILQEIPGSSLNTDLMAGRSLPNILNVSFEAAEGESIQLYLDAERIVVSTGSACAAGDTKPSHVLMAMTGDAEVAHSSVRFSFGLSSTMRDVEEVMRVLPGVIKKLQGMSTVRRQND